MSDFHAGDGLHPITDLHDVSIFINHNHDLFSNLNHKEVAMIAAQTATVQLTCAILGPRKMAICNSIGLFTH